MINRLENTISQLFKYPSSVFESVSNKNTTRKTAKLWKNNRLEKTKVFFCFWREKPVHPQR